MFVFFFPSCLLWHISPIIWGFSCGFVPSTVWLPGDFEVGSSKCPLCWVVCKGGGRPRGWVLCLGLWKRENGINEAGCENNAACFQELCPSSSYQLSNKVGWEGCIWRRNGVLKHLMMFGWRDLFPLSCTVLDIWLLASFWHFWSLSYIPVSLSGWCLGKAAMGCCLSRNDYALVRYDVHQVLSYLNLLWCNLISWQRVIFQCLIVWHHYVRKCAEVVHS